MMTAHPRVAAGVLASLFAVSSVPAQRVAADTARLKDLVVTATRAPSPGPLAAATTVLDGNDLRARGVHLLQDALREVPGMMLVQNGSYGAVTSFFLRGGESDYVKVLVDGVPMNLPGGSLNLADLTLDDVDRIEVVRGPASVLYGADAMSGVIQLFTRRGGSARSGHVGYRSGTFGTSSVEGRASGGSAGAALSLSGSRFASDGIYPFNSRYDNRSGTARLDLERAGIGQLAVTVRGGDVSAGFPTDYTGVPRDRNQRTTERRFALGATATRQLGARTTATVQLFGSRLRAGATNRPDTPADTLGFGFDSDRDAITWRRGAEARVDLRPNGRATISLGGGLEGEAMQGDGRTAQNYGGGIVEELTAFEADRTTRHAFAQLLAAPSARLSLQVGVRLDDNSAFGQFGTWRGGASWQLSRATRVWVAYGTAFKSPTFAELFADDPYEVGNAGLSPERSRSAELAISHQLTARAAVEVTAFDQRFRDLIQYVGAAPGDPTYVNLGAASSRGVEVSVTARATDALSLRAHWTALDTEVRDSGSASSVAFQQGAPLLRRPARSGGATVTIQERGATLAGTVTMVGERADVDYRDFPATRTTLPSYSTVDLALALPVRRGGAGLPSLTATLRGENLFDARYDQVVGFPGRGRTLFVGGQLRY